MSYRNRLLALASSIFTLAALASAGCSVRTGVGDAGPGGGDGGRPGVDANIFRPDGSVDPCVPGCGPDELCGAGDGNGLNDDCDGAVDEGCVCAAGTSRSCFTVSRRETARRRTPVSQRCAMNAVNCVRASTR